MILFFLVLFASSLHVQAVEKFSEKLEIFPLKSSSFAPKTLWHFEFDFQSELNLDSFVTQETIPPRPVLESLIVYTNSTSFKIEVGNGKPNAFLLDGGSFYFNLPKEGKSVFADEYTDWGSLIYQFQEIFLFSVQKLPMRNYYQYNSKTSGTKNEAERRNNFPNYEERFLYGNDPVDYTCGDFIERLQGIFPCQGSKGLLSLLRSSSVFGADYLSSVINFHYDRQEKKIYFRVEFNVIGNNNTIKSSAYEKCNGFHNSKVADYTLQKNLKSSVYNEGVDQFTVRSLESLPKDLFSKNIVKSNRYLTNPRYQLSQDLVHEITNLHPDQAVKVVVSEYLLSHSHPIFHKIKAFLNNKEIVSDKPLFEVEYAKDNYTLFRFTFEIPAGSTLKIRIPFEKLVKQFEMYPHDPTRGEDLIPSVILFSLVKDPEGRTYRVMSEDLLVEVPHIDFSMPFTNIAVSMSIIGFLAMSIYRAIFENPKKVQEENKIKKFLKGLCAKRSQEKSKTD